MHVDSFLINNLDGLQEAAVWVWSRLKGSKHLAFEGEMGAGKTTLIQAVCKYLGVKSEVTSPTFSLVNEYTAQDGSTIYHFDFYRLDDPIEALDFGLDEYLSSEGICMMEWSEKVVAFLPEDTRYLFITVKADGSRLLQLS